MVRTSKTRLLNKHTWAWWSCLGYAAAVPHIAAVLHEPEPLLLHSCLSSVTAQKLLHMSCKGSDSTAMLKTVGLSVAHHSTFGTCSRKLLSLFVASG